MQFFTPEMLAFVVGTAATVVYTQREMLTDIVENFPMLFRRNIQLGMDTSRNLQNFKEIKKDVAEVIVVAQGSSARHNYLSSGEASATLAYLVTMRERIDALYDGIVRDAFETHEKVAAEKARVELSKGHHSACPVLPKCFCGKNPDS